MDEQAVITKPDLVLRPFQESAVAAFAERGRGIIRAPTASGKSPILAALLNKIPGPWLVLVHRRLLRDQLVQQLERFGVKDVSVYDDRRKLSYVTVSTWQGLIRRQNLPTVRAVAVDEVHTSPSPRFSQLLERLNPEIRLGLSATPLLREDGLSSWTRGWFGGIVYCVEAPKLAEEGFVAVPNVQFIGNVVEESKDPEWAKTYAEAVVRNENRNRLLTAVANFAEKPCLVLVNHIEHGLRLQAEFQAGRCHVDFVHAGTDRDGRERAVKRFVDGQSGILIASPVFDAGIDIPSIRSVVLGSGGKSAIACIQRLGRAMRVSAGKSACTLWDFADLGGGVLERHSKRRARAYAMVGFPVNYVGVPVCSSVQPQDEPTTFTYEGPGTFESTVWNIVFWLGCIFVGGVGLTQCF